MSRVSKRLRKDPSPSPSSSPKLEAVSPKSEVNELNEDDYEKERMENIKNNATLLASLGLSSAPSIRPPEAKLKAKLSEREERLTKGPAKRKREVVEPTRRSGRVAALSTETKPDYSGEAPRYTTKEPTRQIIPKSRPLTIPSGPDYEDDDEEFATAPIPERGADGRLIFEGRWKGVFGPNLTPKEMFDGGAFGGGFFTDTYSQILKQPLKASDAISSLPFTPDPQYLSNRYTNPNPEGAHNRFQVRAGQSLQEWEKAGWIWKEDPRGWAEWYVRFWGGRRCVDDERQVRRWLNVAGPTGRFKRSLLKKVHLSGGLPALADEEVGAVLRQCLWQWGYELTEGEYERAMRGD